MAPRENGVEIAAQGKLANPEAGFIMQDSVLGRVIEEQVAKVRVSIFKDDQLVYKMEILLIWLTFLCFTTQCFIYRGGRNTLLMGFFQAHPFLRNQKQYMLFPYLGNRTRRLSGIALDV